jgi:hypothetical protein
MSEGAWAMRKREVYVCSDQARTNKKGIGIERWLTRYRDVDSNEPPSQNCSHGQLPSYHEFGQNDGG